MPTSRFRITDADHFDIQAINRIEAACFRNPWSKEAIASELTVDSGIARVLRCRSTGRIAGYLFARITVEELHILKLAVARQFRRSGGGTRLVTDAIRSARQHGLARAFLEVRASNLTAIKLYEKIGFYIAGIRPGYYTDKNVDASMMVKSL